MRLPLRAILNWPEFFPELVLVWIFSTSKQKADIFILISKIICGFEFTLSSLSQRLCSRYAIRHYTGSDRFPPLDLQPACMHNREQ